jgi:predicted phage terminase large subunit-like protein
MREAEKEMQVTGEWPEDADRWRCIDFPAIAINSEKYRHQGEALHPERYPLAALRKIKRTLAPRDWAALFQQNPQVEEGAYFQKKYFRYYKVPPVYLDVYCAGDLAISKKEHADWSVFYVVGKDENGHLYFLDEYRGRWDTKEIIDVMFEIHKKWHPRYFGLEKGQISLTLDSFLMQRKKEEKIFDLHVDELPPGKQDKELRARTIQGLMALGQVWWPEGALWVDDAVNELLRFPNGVKDDRVDAAAWIGKMVANKTYIGEGQPKSKRKTKSWKQKLAGYVGKTSGSKKPHMQA